MGGNERNLTKKSLTAWLLIVVFPCATLLLFVFCAEDMKFVASEIQHVLDTRRTDDAVLIDTFTVPRRVESLVVSPNDELIAVGSTGQQRQNKYPLVVYNLATGQPVANLNDPKATFFAARAITFSPDGKFLAAETPIGGYLADVKTGKKVVVRLWDTQTWRIVHRFQLKGAHGASGFAFSPDNTTLATFHELFPSNPAPFRSAIHLWDLNTGQLKATLYVSDSATKHLVFSKDGKHLVCCAYRSLYVWDVPSLQKRTVATGKARRFGSPEFSRDSQSLLVTDSGDLCIFDTSTWEEKKRLPLARVRGLVTHLVDRGQVAFATDRGNDSFIVIYDYQIEREVLKFTRPARRRGMFSPKPPKHVAGPVASGIAASSDGNRLCRVWENTLSVWEIPASDKGKKK